MSVATQEEEEKNARRRSFYNHIGFSVGLVVLSVAVLCCVDVKYLPFVLIATVMTLFVIGWRFSLKFAVCILSDFHRPTALKATLLLLLLPRNHLKSRHHLDDHSTTIDYFPTSLI